MKLQMTVAAFGALVRDKRLALGWTQEALAAEALSNADRKGFISQIETGKLPSISALSVQKIARALGLDRGEIDAMLGVVAPDADEVRSEIDALRAERGTLEAALSELKTLTRGQLIALATQFEIERPFDRRDGALVEVLTQKAEEYRSYRSQIERIDDRVAGLGNLKAAAQDAAERLDFDEVEALLLRVDQVETEIAAETKELRAANALLRGRVEDAFTILTAAADGFAGIDPLEGPRRRIRKYFEMLWNHGLRYGGTGISCGIDLLRPVLTEALKEQDEWLWSAGQNLLGVGLSLQGERTAGEAGAALLAEAAEAYRAALRVSSEADHPVGWATVMQNLGGALLRQGERTAGDAGAALLAESVEACRAALRIYTEADHPVNWATTMQNLGAALWEHGKRTSSEAGGDLLAEAVAACRVALRVCTEADHPVQWAGTMQNLGNAFGDQGRHKAGQAGAALLAKSVAAYSAALRVINEADHPVKWAMILRNLAITEVSRADHGTCADPRPHLEAALRHVEASLRVYDPEHMSERYEAATRLREDITARLRTPIDTA